MRTLIPLLSLLLAIATTGWAAEKRILEALTVEPVASCTAAGLVIFTGTTVLNALYSSFCSAQGLQTLVAPEPLTSPYSALYISFLDYVLGTVCQLPSTITQSLAYTSCGYFFYSDGSIVSNTVNSPTICTESQVPICQLAGPPAPTSNILTSISPITTTTVVTSTQSQTTTTSTTGTDGTTIVILTSTFDTIVTVQTTLTLFSISFTTTSLTQTTSVTLTSTSVSLSTTIFSVTLVTTLATESTDIEITLSVGTTTSTTTTEEVATTVCPPPPPSITPTVYVVATSTVTLNSTVTFPLTGTLISTLTQVLATTEVTCGPIFPSSLTMTGQNTMTTRCPANAQCPGGRCLGPHVPVCRASAHRIADASLAIVLQAVPYGIAECACGQLGGAVANLFIKSSSDTEDNEGGSGGGGEVMEACELGAKCLGVGSPMWAMVNGRLTLISGGNGVVTVLNDHHYHPGVDGGTGLFARKHPVLCRIWPDVNGKK